MKWFSGERVGEAFSDDGEGWGKWMFCKVGDDGRCCSLHVVCWRWNGLWRWSIAMEFSRTGIVALLYEDEIRGRMKTWVVWSFCTCPDSLRVKMSLQLCLADVSWHKPNQHLPHRHHIANQCPPHQKKSN